MLQRLPKPAEVALFAALAMICAAIVAASPKQDSAIFFATVPLFLVCVLMGFRRSLQRSAMREVPVVVTEEVLP